MHLLTSVRRTLALASCLFALGATASAAEPAVKTFDLPAGLAAETLKQFAVQSGREIVFAPQAVAKVSTQAVKGDLTPAAALDAMLAETGLIASQDQKTGAFAVRRDDFPNAPRAAQTRMSDRPENDAQQAENPVVLDDFEVQGVRVTGIVNQGVIPREENQATRFIVIDRAEIERSGATNISELFRRSVSFDTRYGASEQMWGMNGASSGGTVARVESLNFRGMGSNQTLVLVNGRRLYAGEGFFGSDVSRIPLGAVERVEIMPVSASAIYGGNALAGAVNIILRRSYSGAEMTNFFGTSTKGGGSEYRGTINLGWASQDGRTSATAVIDYNHREGLRAGERGFYRKALAVITPQSAGTGFDYPFKILGAFSGQPGNVYGFFGPLGIPGNPTARVAAIPANQNGSSLTAAAFSSSAGIVNLGNRPGETYLLPRARILSLTSTVEHELRADGHLAAYFELGLARTKMPRAYSNSNNFSHLFFPGQAPNPFPTFTYVFWDPVDLPRPFAEQSQEVVRAVAGLKGKFSLADNPWFWALDGSWEWTRTKSLSTDTSYPLRTLITNGRYNPLRDVRSFPHNLDPDYVKFERMQIQTPQIGAVNLRANGSAFDLPAGKAKISTGLESRWEDYRSEQTYLYGGWAALPGSGTTPGKQESKTAVARGVRAGFFELTIPIISETQPKFGLRELTLNLAGRLDHYDDFGSSGLRPFVSILVAPSEVLSLRASFSEAFLPPNQTDLYTTVVTRRLSSPDSTPDPLRGNTPIGIYDLISGGNSALKPEEAKNWNLGLIVRPPGFKSFTITLDGFKIERSNTVVIENLKQVFLAAEQFYPNRVIRAQPTPADAAAGYAGNITQLDVRPINLASASTDGIDLNLTWDIAAGSVGDFRVQAGGTFTNSFVVRTAPGATEIDTVGVVTLIDNSPLKYRGNFGVSWKRNRWNASVVGRYVHSYATIGNTQTPALGVFYNPSAVAYDGPSLPSATEFDLQFGYAFPLSRSARGAKAQVLSGTEWTVGVNNVFDRAPPYVTDGFAYYSSFNDPRMRYVYLRVKKTF